jgi:hypothetical protein
MTRSILAVIAVGLGVGVLSGTGCKQTGVGDPCTPEQEYQPTFQGFNPQEVNVESKSFQCQTRLCLVNHFQGRVSCPYGQFGPGSDGTTGTPSGAKDPCYVPGTKDSITGNAADMQNGKVVAPNCVDRTADKAVYCSCRCQNVDGRTDDGANYCTCPDGFHCSQLVTSIGALDTGLTGGYCVKDGTDYNRANACGQNCDPSQKDKCGTKQL